MREVRETVLDKRLSTDEDSIGSSLFLLEESLRVLPGLSVMIEDIQSRLETYEAAKDTRHDEPQLTGGGFDVSPREECPYFTNINI